MGTSKLSRWTILVLTLLLPSCLASAQIATQVGDLSQCAYQCWVEATPPSCKTLDDAACICHSPEFGTDIGACLDRNCSIFSAYSALQLTQAVCDWPVRNRKRDIWAVLPLHIFTMVCIGTRMYAKAFVLRRFGPDDWIMAISAVLYFGWFCVGHYLSQMAFGEDIWRVRPEKITRALMLFYVEMAIYPLLLGLVKSSILSLYLRIFPYERFRMVCYGVLGVLAALTTAWTLLFIFQCHPVSFNWDGWTGQANGTCLDTNKLMYILSLVNLVLEAVIMIMPIPLILRMHTTRRRKFAVVIMFSLGVIVMGATAIRLRFIFKYAKSNNLTYDYVDMIIWTGIEIAVSIIVSSLPSIRLLLHRLFPGLLHRMFTFGGAHPRSDEEEAKSLTTLVNDAPTPCPKSSRSDTPCGTPTPESHERQHRRELSRPITIGGGVQASAPAKKRLELRKAMHMAARRKGVGEVTRALESIMGAGSLSSKASVPFVPAVPANYGPETQTSQSYPISSIPTASEQPYQVDSLVSASASRGLSSTKRREFGSASSRGGQPECYCPHQHDQMAQDKGNFF